MIDSDKSAYTRHISVNADVGFFHLDSRYYSAGMICPGDHSDE